MGLTANTINIFCLNIWGRSCFFSLTSTILEQAKEEGKRKIDRIEAMLKKPKRLLATILVANNFINIAIVILFANLSEDLFTGIENSYVQLFLEVVVITFIILLLVKYCQRFMPIGITSLLRNLWQVLYLG